MAGNLELVIQSRVKLIIPSIINYLSEMSTIMPSMNHLTDWSMYMSMEWCIFLSVCMYGMVYDSGMVPDVSNE